jgi:protein-S-isoprenylcysteine O-methyltransferase Ste14
MEVIGKPTINPLLFYSGKISGYIVWTLFLLSIFKVESLPKRVHLDLDYLSYFLLIIGLLFSISSLFKLGRSTRFGIPTTKTNLKTSGIYSFSRNPIYLGFNLITIAAIIYLPNLLILFPGIYSMIVYHLIIIGEEKFLEKAFGEDYKGYKKKVRRYI